MQVIGKRVAMFSVALCLVILTGIRPCEAG